MIAAGYETTDTAIAQSMCMYLQGEDVRQKTDRAIAEGRTERAIDEYIRLISPRWRWPGWPPGTPSSPVRRSARTTWWSCTTSPPTATPRSSASPTCSTRGAPETDTLAFGAGPHRCIGSHLAKLELSILWEELTQRGIELELAGPPRRGPSMFINVLADLPVRRVRETPCPPPRVPSERCEALVQGSGGGDAGPAPGSTVPGEALTPNDKQGVDDGERRLRPAG